MPFPALLGAVLPSLVGGGLSALSTSQAAKTAQRNTDLTNRANLEVAKFQADYDYNKWREQNLYNAPKAQMERLRAAGLNPNLVYGSGSVTGNVSGQYPKYNAPRLDYNYKPSFDPGSWYAASQDASMRSAQIDNVKESTDNIRARTAVEFLRKSQYLTTNQKKKLELDIAENLRDTHLDTAKSKLDLLKTTLSLQQKDLIYRDLKNEFQKSRNKWERLGVTPRDKLFIRTAVKLAGELGFSTKWITDIIKSGGLSVSDFLK